MNNNAQISLQIDRDLFAKVERALALRQGFKNRSALISHLLSEWLRAFETNATAPTEVTEERPANAFALSAPAPVSVSVEVSAEERAAKRSRNIREGVLTILRKRRDDRTTLDLIRAIMNRAADRPTLRELKDELSILVDEDIHFVVDEAELNGKAPYCWKVDESRHPLAFSYREEDLSADDAARLRTS